MALSKTEQKHGQTVEYHVIVDFPSSMIKRSGPLVVLGYPDRQTYKDHPGFGNPKWAKRVYQVPREDFEPVYFAAIDKDYPYNLHEMLYAYLTGDTAVLPQRQDGSQVEGVDDNFYTDAEPVHEDV